MSLCHDASIASSTIGEWTDSSCSSPLSDEDGSLEGHRSAFVTSRTCLLDEGQSSPTTKHGRTSSNFAFPQKTIQILFFANLAEPLACTGIFAFIKPMIQHRGGIREEDVGRWSGVIESLYFLAQAAMSIPTSFMARYLSHNHHISGGKYVLASTLACLSVFTVAFGFSKSVRQMMGFRCAAGAFAGSSVIVNTMISYATREFKRQPRRENATWRKRVFEVLRPENATSAVTGGVLYRQLGLLLGPAIGGAGAALAKRMNLHQSLIYGIPCILLASCPMIMAIMIILFLREDEPVVRQHLYSKASSETISAISEIHFEETNALKRIKAVCRSIAPIPALYLQVCKQHCDIVLLHAIVVLLGISYVTIWPVYLATSVELGGCGLTIWQATILFIFQGLSSVAMCFAYPSLRAKFSIESIILTCGMIWPFSWSLWILVNHIGRSESTPARLGFPLLTAMASIASGAAASTAFASLPNLINQKSTEHARVLYSVTFMLRGVFSGLAPVGIGWIFAVGVKEQILEGYLAWVVMIGTILLMIACAEWVRYRSEISQLE